MEKLTIISTRMVITTVTEFEHKMMEKYIEESGMRAGMTVMDS